MLRIVFKALLCGLGLALLLGEQLLNIRVYAGHERAPGPSSGPVTSSPVTDDDLPADLDARNRLLASFYNNVIPKLLSWNLKQNMRDFPAIKSLFSADSYPLMFEGLFTPVPFNPYRVPEMNQSFLFPGNANEWNQVEKSFQVMGQFHQEWVNLAKAFLEKVKGKSTSSVKLIPDVEEIIRSNLTRPPAFTVKDLQDHQTKRNSIFASSLTQNPLVKMTLTPQDIPLIEQFADYHEQEVKKIRAFFNEFESVNADMLFESLYPPVDKQTTNQKTRKQNAQEILAKARPYFLSGRKSPHQLINVEPLQGKTVGDAEVIIFDPEHVRSSHLQYSPLSEFHKSKTHSERETVPQYTHSSAVAGVIGASDELAHLKGVAPGARILSMNNIDSANLDKIRHSTARVINISQYLGIPMRCASYFKNQASKTPSKPQDLGLEQRVCSDLWKFANLVQEKDLLVVIGASNDGIQIERVNLENGQYIDELTNKARAKQYELIDPNLTQVWQQIPPLRDRVILVGNLRQDGVTIAKDSNLPGAQADNFIFAPSEDIVTLYASTFPLKEDKVGELGRFGGTSGAAPRVTGVVVLLGRLFPSLSMSQIRKCILETGDAFWNEPNNKFTWLKPFAKTKEGKQIFGNGRINAMNAYHCCLELKPASMHVASLNLEDNRKGKRLDKMKESKTISAPLLEAIYTGNLDEVKAYYEGTKGVPGNPYVRILSPRDGTFKWPWEIALETPNPEIIEYLGLKSPLEKHEATELFYSTFGLMEDLSWFQKLIDKGADVNFKDPQGMTLLIRAVYSAGQGADLLSKIQLLLKNKSDVNIQDSEGDAALHLAAAESDLKLCELLIQNGAKVNLQNEAGDTPLHKVVTLPDYDPIHLKIVELLLNNGADLSLKNKDSLTALEVAHSLHGKSKVIKALEAAHLTGSAMPAVRRDG